MASIHPSLTEDRLIAAVEETMHELRDIGFCTACGDEVDGVEPDATGYYCSACDTPGTVFGAEHLLLLHATLDR
jgi:hypothetical protein